MPKTIDNDLPLPDNAPTFGFETARSVGAGILESLMEDARTTARWYVVVCMGRKSGSLALGMCKAAGSTLAVLPRGVSRARDGSHSVADTIVGAIVKRRSFGRQHGVAVVAGGHRRADRDDAALGTTNFAHDAFGNVALADVPLGIVLRDAVRRRLSEIGSTPRFTRRTSATSCAARSRCRSTSTTRARWASARFATSSRAEAARSSRSPAAACIRSRSTSCSIPQRDEFERVKWILTTEAYRVARDYMVYLEPADFTDRETLDALAAQTKLGPDEFRVQFERIALP